MTAAEAARPERRRMSWAFLAASLLAFFFLEAIVSVIVTHGDEVREQLASVSNVMRALVVPYAVSTLVACAVTQRLGWWDVVLHERVRARRWVWIVPIALLGASVATIPLPEYQPAMERGVVDGIATSPSTALHCNPQAL